LKKKKIEAAKKEKKISALSSLEIDNELDTDSVKRIGSFKKDQ